MIEFGIRLKELRNEHNLSQVKLSQVLLVAQRTIFAWEKNIQEPSMEMIINIAKYFNVTTDYLLGLENDDGSKITSCKNYNNMKNNNDELEINEYNQKLIKLSSRELDLLRMYRTLSCQYMDRVDDYIIALYEVTNNYEEKK